MPIKLSSSALLSKTFGKLMICSDKLYQQEIKNLVVTYFGYGAKGFTLSMIESLIEISEGNVLSVCRYPES